MKNKIHFHAFKTRRGSALIIVLALLLLMTMLVIGLLLRAGSAQRSAAELRAAGNISALTDRAVNLVQGQINEATSPSPGSAWASQPGAIRVFNSSGNLSKVFRLYSSSAMKPNMTDGMALANDVPPDDWAGSPATWCDLNAPARVREPNGATTLRFPILDPRDPTSPGPLNAPSTVPSTKLKGFYLGKIPGYSSDAAGTSGATDVPGATTAQPIPMPVQWLYVLQDGKMVAPGAGSGSDIAMVPGANADNPIVGRIAYWTDDECSKVNINTAAGNARGDGTYASWDTPHFTAFQDVNYFSKALPLGKEYQRYPGHPATTNLYDILNGLGYNTGYASGSYPGTLGNTSPFFSLLPYYNDDYGSKQATFFTNDKTTTQNPTAKSDRLYSSLSELYYKPGRTTNDAVSLTRHTLETGKFFLTTASRAPEITLFGTPRVSVWPIDVQVTGTAASKPKVSAYDQMIAFCSSVRKEGTTNQRNPYFVQRQMSKSMTNDWDNIARNRQLFEYLMSLTSLDIPGFGGNFAAKYSVNNEWDQIMTEIFDYIRCTNLSDANLAGGNRFGISNGVSIGHVMPLRIKRGSVITQGLGRYYTISEAALLVICTADGNGPTATTNGSANDWRSVSNLAVAGKLKNASGTLVGKDGTAGTNFDANPTLTNGDYGSALAPLAPGQKKLQAMLVMEPSTPLAGNPGCSPAFKLRVRGLNNIVFSTGTGSASPFPPANESRNILYCGDSPIGGGTLLGCTLSPRWMTALVNRATGLSNTRVSGWVDGTNTSARYPFVSNPFTVQANTTDSTMSVSGTFYIDVYASTLPSLSTTATPVIDASTDILVQTFEISLPGTAAPVPDLLQNGLFYPTASPSIASDWWGFTNRIARLSDVAVETTSVFQSGGALIRADLAPANGTAASGWTISGSAAKVPWRDSAGNAGFGSDTTLSFVPYQCDFRLTAAKPEVKTSTPAGAANPDYEKHEFYGQRKLAHSFTDATHFKDTNYIQGFSGGKLARNVTYRAAYTPKVPTNLPADASTQGDWDSGWPVFPDGACANMADEGNLGNGVSVPFFEGLNVQQSDAKYFSPNIKIPSAVMMGSLPTGVKQNIPWRTLCFRPQKNRPLDPTSGPKDYLLLDLFQMPVIDPYAISEPFSTAGKINMNYAIVPFSYITRSTGVRAVLSSEMVARVPASSGSDYKLVTTAVYNAPTGPASPARLPINLSEVNGALRQFQERFAKGDIFRSPAEICGIYLPPDASRIGGNQYNWTTDKEADDAWYDPSGDFALLGDNVRERPYASIYPRLTTKSNTFKIYYTVQALKNPTKPGADPSRWDEKQGVIEGEFRGSTTLERFIDPENPNIKDYASDPSFYTPGSANIKTLDSYYQWRVISNNAFPH